MQNLHSYKEKTFNHEIGHSDLQIECIVRLTKYFKHGAAPSYDALSLDHE